MVISFKEQDRTIIEAYGMTIIEFKRILCRMEKRIQDNWTELHNLVKDLTEKIVKAWKLFEDKLLEAADGIKFLFERIREMHQCSVSLRYRFVKTLSKCTGMESQKIWKMTRHTWLARNCC